MACCGPSGGYGSQCGTACNPCCPPIVIKTPCDTVCGQTCVFQLPPVNIVCEIPPVKVCRPPKHCCVNLIVCDDECAPACGPCGPKPCCLPVDYCCPQRGGGCGGYGGRGCY